MTGTTIARLATLATTLTLALAPVAHADHGPPVDDPFALYSFQVAIAYWDTEIPCAHMAWSDEPGNAKAEVGGCRIWLQPAWRANINRVQRCETIVHEYGHLIGLGHTRDYTIMDQFRSDGLVRGCDHPRKGISFRAQRIRRH